MADATFREWLAQRVGDGEGKVSRRELSRRLAAQHPGHGDPESARRTIRRILDGESNPTQSTRDSIQDALDDHSAPFAADEEPRPDPLEAPLLELARAVCKSGRRSLLLKIAQELDVPVTRTDRELARLVGVRG